MEIIKNSSLNINYKDYIALTINLTPTLVTNEENNQGTRIAKWIAARTPFSRRYAEQLIAEGKVSIDGLTIDKPTHFLKGYEKVMVDGISVTQAKPEAMLWRYHKSRGTIVTQKDPEGRPSVFEDFPKTNAPWITVGRLDFNTEGLLLVTNSGSLANELANPKFSWVRKYLVRAFGSLQPDTLEELQKGIEIDGVLYQPHEVLLTREMNNNLWFSISLMEGKNREIHRLMEKVGLVVSRMIRISFGPFSLGTLAVKGMERVPARLLKKALNSDAQENDSPDPTNKWAKSRSHTRRNTYPPKAATPQKSRNQKTSSHKNHDKKR
jgi:23S rRNA pseudouridine2605 synthase